MKSTKRIYIIHCQQPLRETQIMNIQSLLGVDSIEYTHPKFKIQYDLRFINREVIIKHLKQENIQFKNSLLNKLFNWIEIFSEKNIIKNNRLLPFYG